MKHLLAYFVKHKFFSSVIILIIIGGSGYFFYQRKNGQPGVQYLSTPVVKGAFIASVSGSGQVLASNQADVKPKVSGEVLAVYATAGQEVKTGTALARLDSRDAQKTVRDAEINLETAKLSLEKVKQPADELSVLQAQNSLLDAQNSKTKAEDDLKKTYEDGFNSVTSAFLDFPGVMSNLYGILYSYALNQNQQNINYLADAVRGYDQDVDIYRGKAEASYQKAKQEYDPIFLDYKTVSRYSDAATIATLIENTYLLSLDISEAVKNCRNFLDFYKENIEAHSVVKISTQVESYLSNLENITSKINGVASSLLSVQTSIKNAKQQITATERNIQERTISLQKLQAGPDALDLRSQELAVAQRQSALADAKEKLADYTVRAPFDGVITELSVKRGDNVSTGTTIVTLITKQRLAEITLNEIDVAKVEVGQKATLTFDALEDFQLTGGVIEVDTIGTISSGVVSYNAKIGFDSQDDRIKPGMSVSASIITIVSSDVLLVPNAAIKTDSTQGSYVEVLRDGAVQVRLVEVDGANDTMTQITGQIQEGEEVVTQSIQDTQNQAQTQLRNNNSILPIGGGGFRVQTGGGR